MVAWCARFARRALLNERPRVWAVLGGKTGCGKSRSAKRAIRIIRENAILAYEAGHWAGRLCTTAWLDWPRVAEIPDESDYAEAIRDAMEADVVLLDDIGAEVDRFKSGAPASRLRRLLSDLEGKAVLATTNIPKEDWAKTWDPRVASRLSAARFLDCFDVPDFRGAKS